MADAPKVHAARYLDAYNRAAYDELDDFVTSDYVHHSNADALTLTNFKRGAAWMRAAMPDFVVEAIDMISEGDRLAVRWIGQGTHGGSMFGEPVSGRRLTLHGTTVYRFAEGRIAEDWEVFDTDDLRRQAGAAPTDSAL